MKDRIKVLIDEDTLSKRIYEVAKEIEKDYKGEELILVCVLKGSVYFTVDLSKRINDCDVILDFMKASSYGDGTETTREVKITMDLKSNIENKNVIIIEDILDSGYTLDYVVKYLNKKNPKSLKVCVLLDKKERREKEVNVDYKCFDIDNKFVVGYGLDYAEKYRNLPYIGYIED